MHHELIHSPCSRLGYMARELMNQLGSGLIQNLRFRDVWFFVGQKGIEGFTQLEQVSTQTVAAVHVTVSTTPC